MQGKCSSTHGLQFRPPELSFSTGDRLISVDNVSLEGVSHHAAIEILQSAPDEVILVISQPKEKISKGKHECLSVCAPFHFPQFVQIWSKQYFDPKTGFQFLIFFLTV